MHVVSQLLLFCMIIMQMIYIGFINRLLCVCVCVYKVDYCSSEGKESARGYLSFFFPVKAFITINSEASSDFFSY